MPEEKRDLHVVHEMGKNHSTITPDEPKKVQYNKTLKELDVEFDALRIRNDGAGQYNTIIEVKNSDGNWEMLSGVQTITLEISVEKPVPRVKIDRYLINKPTADEVQNENV